MINTILINIKINQPKVLNMCECKLPINGQNFMEVYVKISQYIMFFCISFTVSQFCLYCTLCATHITSN